MAAKGGEKEGGEVSPVKSNIRRYYCPYSSICGSKKALIASLVRSQHEEESGNSSANGTGDDTKAQKGYTCEECGATFRKPAYLKQHMQGHSDERKALDPI